MGISPYPLVVLSEAESISPSELSILEDRQFLLTKRNIDSKVTGLLLVAQKALISHITARDFRLPDEVSTHPRKIARGENYNGLPYWVSDHPTCMEKTDIWSYRTVVWWGQQISHSLILKGKFKSKTRLLFETKPTEKTFYSICSDPWKLEINKETSLSLQRSNELRIKQHQVNADFIKLTQLRQLREINQLPLESVRSFDALMKSINYLA
jgi:hypothetical protein